jgi:DMSO/TMAO reductase YedYZ heme-binding membrane subunit
LSALLAVLHYSWMVKADIAKPVGVRTIAGHPARMAAVVAAAGRQADRRQAAHRESRCDA